MRKSLCQESMDKSHPRQTAAVFCNYFEAILKIFAIMTQSFV